MLNPKAVKQACHRACMVVGIGSHHGDDRVGWEVVDRLTDKHFPITQCSKATVPHDLLDWLDADTPTHIIDGCQDDEFRVRRIVLKRTANGQLQCIDDAACSGQKSCVIMPNLRSGSTHSFDLLSAIQLAAELSRLPEQLILWAVPVQQTAKNGALSRRATAAVEECVCRITKELAHA